MCVREKNWRKRNGIKFRRNRFFFCVYKILLCCDQEIFWKQNNMISESRGVSRKPRPTGIAFYFWQNLIMPFNSCFLWLKIWFLMQIISIVYFKMCEFYSYNLKYYRIYRQFFPNKMKYHLWWRWFCDGFVCWITCVMNQWHKKNYIFLNIKLL